MSYLLITNPYGVIISHIKKILGQNTQILDMCSEGQKEILFVWNFLLIHLGRRYRSIIHLGCCTRHELIILCDCCFVIIGLWMNAMLNASNIECDNWMQCWMSATLNATIECDVECDVEYNWMQCWMSATLNATIECDVECDYWSDVECDYWSALFNANWQFNVIFTYELFIAHCSMWLLKCIAQCKLDNSM